MFNRQPKNITNHYHNVFRSTTEIDYDKLAKAIIKAQQEADNQKEIEKKETEEKQRDEIIKKRLENLKCAKDFDEEGNPIHKRAKNKLIWNFIWAKEKDLKDISIIDSSINSLVALFFAAIEWLLYLIAIVLAGFFIFDIIRFVDACICGNCGWQYLLSAIDFLIYGFVSFIFSRIIIRTLKIDCKYNKDSHYMMSFLAVIVSIIAIIVAIILE